MFIMLKFAMFAYLEVNESKYGVGEQGQPVVADLQRGEVGQRER